jgi:GT2 family glycosyltransferase
MEPELIIVIGTRNRKEILVKCLNALIGNIEAYHKIVVIDAGSTDGTIEYLQQIKEIHLICDGKPIGQAQSFNRVFRSLKGQFICWLSDDNVVQPGVLDSAVKILRQNDKIGLVALKVRDLKGPKTGKPYLGAIYKTGILNCNQGIIRSDLFKKIGYFDESFKNYGIDPDVTTKVLLSGYRVVYTKAIAIHHYRDHGAEEEAISKAERAKSQERTSEMYNTKYAHLIECSVLKKCDMLTRKYIWRCIKALNKILENGRYISIFDLFHNRNNSYYLEQFIPRRILLSNKNRYKNFID